MIKYYTMNTDYNLNMPLPVKEMGNDQLEVLNKDELKLLNEILNNNKYCGHCLNALDERIPWGVDNLGQASFSRLYRAITMREFYVSDLEPTYVYWTMNEDYELHKQENREAPEVWVWPVLTEHEFEELRYLLDDAYAYSSLLSHVFEDLLDETDGVSFTQRGFDKVATILIDGEFYVEVRHEDLDGEDDE